MSKRKILGIEKLNKRFGLFDNNHNYNLSEKSIKTRPYSFQLWAVSYVVSEVARKWNFDEIAFMMMISDLRYFEDHVIIERSGWSQQKYLDIRDRLLDSGYLRREVPKTEKAIYKNLIYKTPYKYYPTHRYRMFIQRIEDALRDLHEQVDKCKEMNAPSKDVKGRGFEY